MGERPPLPRKGPHHAVVRQGGIDMNAGNRLADLFPARSAGRPGLRQGVAVLVGVDAVPGEWVLVTLLASSQEADQVREKETAGC
ncbi:hypothetical protein ACWDR9_13265 [Streptosporangium sandarakinum]|uniref:hypothetical protein n=1 Tax=Streptosporangium sandarakinum TaxID=1260955 RepID=UPI00368614DB